ncbi:class I SAM-dependent methyltransferase [Pyrococcus furiosus DSM 3638]|uniref:Methyltransferase n=3 Tax=Pyrococcus furiosus TaxID=2261 RepID=Q8U4F1_PYRFU|nr:MULTISPECIES: class I SAM-dependent methyltransferase [Pyrococcus]AAL80261.1 putative methyltransferase [Pyrococcus furiosus DSM 3638]AFN04439.1 methyltransferase [Pyrococcus furiosus COM1]MDK2870598.1 hypothetical protein [Pyrococcus sp.]QEK77867.1 class I SAM-dependent methyltransferase [Pyrococcus furiosus DSM 3638]
MGFKEYYRAFPTYTKIESKEYKGRVETLGPILIKYMNKNRGKVLDLACGVGGFSFFLEDLGFDVVGLDNNPEMIEAAKRYAEKRSSKVNFVVGDAKNLPFENNSFDYVIFIDSIFHFTPSELNQVFKEVKRVIKPEGRFLIYFTDLRELLPNLKERLVIGEKYWVNRITTDTSERIATIEFKSEDDEFRVEFNIWGKTGVELLAKLYFTKEAEEKVGGYSYLIVYNPK